VKLEALQENLKRGFATVMPAVATKSTLPVLGMIQLTADDSGWLWLAASNLEIGIRTRIGARVEESGAVCLPAKLLSDFIAGLPNVPISFALDERTQTITIKAGTYKTEIKGIEADEFPVLVTSGGDPLFSMPGSDWALVADKVAMAAATEIGRPVLAGVHIFANNGITFEAADGYRLARKVFPMDCAAVDTIIPATSLTVARKAFASDADVSLSMANSGALALFTSESTTLQSRVINGKYPDCDRQIPTTYNSRLILSVADLLSQLRIAKPFAEASSNIVRLDLVTREDREGTLTITAKAAEIGDHSGSVDVIASGSNVAIALNINYLLQAVAACAGGDLAIELQDGSRPAVLRAVGDESLLQLVMPMAVR
jgi:DNA polymerase-3 subunit beta